MVVDILVAQRQSKNPLGDQMRDGMLDDFGVAVIGEASGKSSDDRQFRFDFSQQQSAGIGGQMSAGEIGDDFPGIGSGKANGLLAAK